MIYFYSVLGEQRFIHNQILKSICWHMEGKQFVCSYADGSLCTYVFIIQFHEILSCLYYYYFLLLMYTYISFQFNRWNVRPPAQASERSERKPALVIFPHGKKNKETGILQFDIIFLLTTRFNFQNKINLKLQISFQVKSTHASQLKKLFGEQIALITQITLYFRVDCQSM